jgi:hypothetical protein
VLVTIFGATVIERISLKVAKRALEWQLLQAVRHRLSS